MTDIELTENLLAAQCRAKLVLNNSTNPKVVEHVVDALLSLAKARQLLPKTEKVYKGHEKMSDKPTDPRSSD